jgi:hypothetical protein
MRHYIQLRDAEVARNTIDLAAVVHVAAPVLATVQPSVSDTGNLAIKRPVPSPNITQDLERSAPLLPTLPDISVVTPRSSLPDFLVGGYKVKSDKKGNPKDDEVYKSHKYI